MPQSASKSGEAFAQNRRMTSGMEVSKRPAVRKARAMIERCRWLEFDAKRACGRAAGLCIAPAHTGSVLAAGGAEFGRGAHVGKRWARRSSGV